MDDEVVGWTQVGRTLTLEAGEQAELVGLAVDERHRGRGLGGTLVAEAETWARTQGLAVLRVRCHIHRKATHRFCARLGFGEVKRQVVFQTGLVRAPR